MGGEGARARQHSRLAALLASAAVLSWAEEEVCPAGQPCGAPAPGPEPQHYWTHSRGRPGKYGSTSIVGPSDLKASLAWEWHHPTRAILPGSALIDEHKNLYVAALDGLRKFTPNGQILWFYKAEGFYMHANPSIMGNVVYGGGIAGVAFALNMEDGKEIWKKKYCEAQEMDTPYFEAHDGVVLAICDQGPDAYTKSLGNTKAYAFNASDGSTLWEYQSNTVLWNFMPLFPGDGTFVFMDIHGGVFRYRLHEWTRVWYTPPPWQYTYSFTDGGVMLGPKGDLFVCANQVYGMVNTKGALRAYRLSDGRPLWERELPQPCVSWAAADGRMVVVPIGGLPSPLGPAHTTNQIPSWLKLPMHRLSNLLGREQSWLWWNKKYPLHVLAFDEETGQPLWKFDKIDPWPRVSCRGDEELWEERVLTWPHRAVCGPASWSAGTIGGDGTYYAGSMAGIMYAIRDANGDGVIDERTEVSTMDIGAASLHPGHSFAPGLMAYGSCEGLWVFKF